MGDSLCSPATLPATSASSLGTHCGSCGGREVSPCSCKFMCPPSPGLHNNLHSAAIPLKLRRPCPVPAKPSPAARLRPPLCDHRPLPLPINPRHTPPVPKRSRRSRPAAAAGAAAGAHRQAGTGSTTCWQHGLYRSNPAWHTVAAGRRLPPGAERARAAACCGRVLASGGCAGWCAHQAASCHDLTADCMCPVAGARQSTSGGVRWPSGRCRRPRCVQAAVGRGQGSLAGRCLPACQRHQPLPSHFAYRRRRPRSRMLRSPRKSMAWRLACSRCVHLRLRLRPPAGDETPRPPYDPASVQDAAVLCQCSTGCAFPCAPMPAVMLSCMHAGTELRAWRPAPNAACPPVKCSAAGHAIQGWRRQRQAAAHAVWLSIPYHLHLLRCGVLCNLLRGRELRCAAPCTSTTHPAACAFDCAWRACPSMQPRSAFMHACTLQSADQCTCFVLIR